MYYLIKALAVAGEIALSFAAYRMCIKKAIKMVNDEGYAFVDAYIIKNILLKNNPAKK